MRLKSQKLIQKVHQDHKRSFWPPERHGPEDAGTAVTLCQLQQLSSASCFRDLPKIVTFVTPTEVESAWQAQGMLRA